MDYPDSWPDGWDIAGWEDGQGQWHNTESGDRIPEGGELWDTEQIVVHIQDEQGVDHYYSIMGGVDDWDGLMDAIDDIIEEYG